MVLQHCEASNEYVSIVCDTDSVSSLVHKSEYASSVHPPLLVYYGVYVLLKILCTLSRIVLLPLKHVAVLHILCWEVSNMTPVLCLVLTLAFWKSERLSISSRESSDRLGVFSLV